MTSCVHCCFVFAFEFSIRMIRRMNHRSGGAKEWKEEEEHMKMGKPS